MAEFMLECFQTLERQQTEVIRALANNNEYIVKRDVMEMLDLNQVQAGALLKRMVEYKYLIRVSSGKTTRYVKYQKNVKLSAYSQEEKVLEIFKKKKMICNKDVQETLGISGGSANVLLSGMVKKSLIKRVARGQYRKQ